MLVYSPVWLTAVGLCHILSMVQMAMTVQGTLSAGYGGRVLQTLQG